MKRRMLDGGIWANDKFARLPYPARLLQMGLINLADDQGRMIAHPSYLRSQIFPYDEEVSGGDIRKWLGAIVANGTAIVYQVDSKEYVQLINWWDYQTLQYASPSEHPRLQGWEDRIRYNAKGGTTLTCNWITPKGETPEDTCDQDGNPLPIVAGFPRRNPGGRPPQNPPVNGRENPDGNTNKEEIKINTNQEQEQEGESARAQPTRIASPREPSTKTLPHKSPHLDSRHFVNGYIPPGTGTNPLEVYYERFSINQDVSRLNAIKEDDLVHLCPDLDKLREVVVAYSRTSFHLGNLQLILDWYRDGIPDKQKPPGVANGNSRMSPVDKTQTAANELRAMLTAQGKEKWIS